MPLFPTLVRYAIPPTVPNELYAEVFTFMDKLTDTVGTALLVSSLLFLLQAVSTNSTADRIKMKFFFINTK